MKPAPWTVARLARKWRDWRESGAIGAKVARLARKWRTCLHPPDDVSILAVKRLPFSEVKRQEARHRMAALRRSARSPQAAAALRHRASLVGDGAKWRIINWKQVARAIARHS